MPKKEHFNVLHAYGIIGTDGKLARDKHGDLYITNKSDAENEARADEQVVPVRVHYIAPKRKR